MDVIFHVCGSWLLSDCRTLETQVGSLLSDSVNCTITIRLVFACSRTLATFMVPGYSAQTTYHIMGSSKCWWASESVQGTPSGLYIPERDSNDALLESKRLLGPLGLGSWSCENFQQVCAQTYSDTARPLRLSLIASGARLP